MYRRLRNAIVVTFVTLAIAIPLHAQKTAIKTNLLYGATSTPNLQLEIGLSKKSSLELGAGANWFELGNNKKFKNLLFQPEYRYWFCETFNGSFIGVHAHVAQFNVGGLDVPFGRLKVLKENRLEGYLYGAGLSYGYQWILSSRWNLEASIGAGYAYIDYEKYECPKCGDKLGDGKQSYFGVTKAALSLIYIIK